MSAEEVVETVVDTATELAEVKEMGDAPGLYISNSGLARLSLLAGFALAGTAFLTYKITQKRMETKYETILSKEVAEAKKFYAKLYKKGEHETPEKVVKNREEENQPHSDELSQAAQALVRYQGRSPAVEEEEEDIEVEVKVTMNGDVADPDFDLEAEQANRSPDEPYIISEEEFSAGFNEFEQGQLTYYAGDDTLVDDKDSEIPYPDPIIGVNSLARFGHGSGSDRIVFVRNERLNMDFEIELHDGKFSHEVLGFQHSDGGSRARRLKNQPRKIKGDA
jgi:hypothetical protein